MRKVIEKVAAVWRGLVGAGVPAAQPALAPIPQPVVVRRHHRRY